MSAEGASGQAGEEPLRRSARVPQDGGEAAAGVPGTSAGRPSRRAEDQRPLRNSGAAAGTSAGRPGRSGGPEGGSRSLCKGAVEEERRTGMKQEGEDAELRLILVGRTGGGKSATGNTILGRREFESTLGAKTTTLRCQKGQGSWKGMKVSVIDTPAIFDSDNRSKSLQAEITECSNLSWPGPHALIFVTQVGRFTAEDAAAAKRVWKIFGAKSTKQTIVLFTCKEDLGGDPLREYVQGSKNKALRALIRQCGHRVCGFNNKAEGAEREGQVSELMGMVEEMVQENGLKIIPPGPKKNWIRRVLRQRKR